MNTHRLSLSAPRKFVTSGIVFLLFIAVAPSPALGGSCREMVAGIPFALPSAVLPSLRDDKLYVPHPAQSKVPGYIDTYFKGGKRLRPLMVYLAALAHGYQPRRVQDLAGLVEMIHLGSLALDDIIDEAKERRGQTPLYIAQGFVPGVITGPWLQAYVFQRGARVTNAQTMARLADVLMAMGDGEILQAELKARAQSEGTYTQQEYLKVALGKTGHLFGFSLAACSLHFKHSDSVVDLWTRLGQYLGVSYQMKDDFEDAILEVGEVNFAHWLRSDTFGGSPFAPMRLADLQTLIPLQNDRVASRNREMHSMLDRLQSVVPRPLSDEQQAAFGTLREMVDYVSVVPQPQ